MTTTSGSGCFLTAWLSALLTGGLLAALLFVGVRQETTGVTTDGAAVTYNLELVLAPVDASAPWEQLQAAQEVIDRRLLSLSANGQIMGGFTTTSDRLSLQITVRLNPGMLTTREVVAALTEGGYIELVDFSSVPGNALQGYVGERIVTSAMVARSGDDRGQTVFPTVLTHEDIVQATVVESAAEGLPPTVQVDFTEEAATRLGAFSEAHLGSGMAIVLDGEVLSVPIVQARIADSAVITGNFSAAEVQVLAAQINSRPLPIPLYVVSSTQILPE